MSRSSNKRLAPVLVSILAIAELTSAQTSEEATERVLAEIDVTSSYSIDRDEPVSSVALTQEELFQLPHFGDDLYRALAVLPGVTGNDVSAQFNLRGGLYRDTALTIDRLEIFEPFHLKDFQGVFSIIDPDVVGSVDLIPGGMPAEYGDKMAGVLDMRTARPDSALQRNLGISLASAWAGASGSYGEDREGRWLVSARRGYLDLLLDIAGDDDEEESEGSGPEYWDLIAKIDQPISDSQSLSVKLLASDDSLEEREVETDDFGFPEREEIDSDYSNSYLWLTHQAILGSRVFVDTLASAGRVERDRFASEEAFNSAFEIRDIRTTDVFSLRQDWNAQLGDRHYLKWGFEARSYDTDYDYRNDYAFTGPLGDEGLTRFVNSFSGEHYALYAADRFQISPKLVVEMGARWDRQTLTDDDQFSPRVNVLYDLGRAGAVRAAWGHYHQSQRPHELQVEDGETEFQKAERATTFQVGWERQLGRFLVRADVYRREVSDPRPYYTNLFEAFDPNPEATRDRVLIEPEESEATGLELFVSRRSGKKFSWWASYTLSEVTDLVDGRDIPRSYDQRHALTLDGNYRFGPKWNVNAAWTLHSGWPTTAISADLVEGPDGEPMVMPILGPLNDESLSTYHRLDVRVARFMPLKKRGTLEFFVDIQNLYNRENVAGFSVDERNFVVQPDGTVQYNPTPEEWLGVLPSFGVSWKF